MASLRQSWDFGVMPPCGPLHTVSSVRVLDVGRRVHGPAAYCASRAPYATGDVAGAVNRCIFEITGASLSRTPRRLAGALFNLDAGPNLDAVNIGPTPAVGDAQTRWG